MNKMLKVITLIVLTSGLILTGCSSGAEPPEAGVGNQALDFQLNNLDGQSVSLSDFRGKPVFINFWASWCFYCREEMPYIQEIYEEWSGKGLVVLTINVGESPSQAEELLESQGLSLPVLLDTKGNVAQRYNIQISGKYILPTSFFIDKDGVIQTKIIGAFPSKEAIEKSLSKIIP